MNIQHCIAALNRQHLTGIACHTEHETCRTVTLFGIWPPLKVSCILARTQRVAVGALLGSRGAKARLGTYSLN